MSTNGTTNIFKTVLCTKLLVHAAKCIFVKLVDALKQESASI